ncbi:MAG: DEAD/DEAH box helicase [Actinomycetota bacterium]|nr:DEAD/DEAH box helicase [Actinomycetota bacterium]
MTTPKLEGIPVVDETPVEIPATTKSFSEFGVSPEIVKALAMRNVAGTFAIQSLVLRDAIAGRDVLARSRTGSGKTLAFAVPIIERLKDGEKRPSALVLVPTRELASQVAEEFRGIADVKHLTVATIYGGVGLNEQAKKGAKAAVLIATPGRLLDLVRRKMLKLDNVRICVLDEADRMLDMGFLPDVQRILALLPQERQTMLFSATLDGEVGRLAQRFTHDSVLHEVHDDRPTVAEAKHLFISVKAEGKLNALVRELAGERGLTLIFVRTKRGADRLGRQLAAEGFRAHAMHGDMTQSARERTLARFAAGGADVLVATDVAARGLDLEHITHVVNYDPPDDEKSYVHRVGRTARAGRTGTGITFVTPEQRGDMSRIAKRLKLDAEFLESGMKLAAPQKVYSGGRGPNRMLGRRPRRKF